MLNFKDKLALFESNAPPNKSMDVRAKQRLSYHVVILIRSCAVAVSPHVISIVRLLSLTVGVKLLSDEYYVLSKVRG